MGVNNAAVFKMVPDLVPEAIGGASGWVGGLGAFGGFAIPPVMGKFVEVEGRAGYAHGFSVFILLALLAFFCAYMLNRAATASEEG
jgi:NNP family nitrate/nitrite transporter-like MFS transporter